MLVSKEVEISVLNNNKKYLKSKGYDISNKKVIIKIEDLPAGSDQIIIAKCDLCNNEFNISYYNYNKLIKKYNICICNEINCLNIKKKKTNLAKFGFEWASKSPEIKYKTKENNIEKWGYECPLLSPEIKEKIRDNNLEKWGVYHPMKSDVLKNKIKENNLEKWGCEYIFQIESVRDKIKESLLNKYGVDNPMKSKDIYNKSIATKISKYNDPKYNNREKFNLTNLERYGMPYTQTKDYKDKSKSTSLKKYNTEYPIQSECIKNKSRKTKLEKYGNPNYNNIKKTKITNSEKYGVEYSLQNDIVRNKIKNTNLERYGVKNFIELPSVIKNRQDAYNKKNKECVIETYSKLMPDNYKIIDYFSSEFIINHNNHQFISSTGLLYDRIKSNCEICLICNPLNSNSSSYENEIIEWLKSNNEYVESRNRNIIGNLELDIYIPNKKVAIEFNGLYWHSDRFKNKYYHVEKTKRCDNIGIDLLHIFEDDWNNKKDIVKSIIKNKLKLITNTIYARECTIKSIKLNECKEFLIKNHIQGYSRCAYKIGLFYKSELVSVMTFGNRRTNSTIEFELIRFCNKIDTIVIGGASKLFTFFIKNYNYSGKIVSYADASLFSGGLYEKLGFSLAHLSKPNYYWVVNGIRYHRFKYNKKKLVEKFNSDINKSESEIMSEMGYYKIWACGQYKYEAFI